MNRLHISGVSVWYWNVETGLPLGLAKERADPARTPDKYRIAIFRPYYELYCWVQCNYVVLGRHLEILVWILEEHSQCPFQCVEEHKELVVAPLWAIYWVSLFLKCLTIDGFHTRQCQIDFGILLLKISSTLAVLFKELIRNYMSYY